METYKVTNIVWEDENDFEEGVDLPSETTIEVNSNLSEEEVQSEIFDILNDDYGYCPGQFDFEKVKVKE